MSSVFFIFLAGHASEVLGARIQAPKVSEDDFATKVRLLAFQNCETKSEQKHDGGLFGSGHTDLSCINCASDSVMFQGPPPSQFENFSMEEIADAVSMKIKNHCSRFDGDDSKKMIMIRHGQSKWNKVTEEYGWKAQAWGMSATYTDSPLSQDGLRQAQKFAALLRDAETVDEDAEHKGNSTSALKAMEELSYTDLEQLLHIKKGGEVQSNAALVEGLRNHKEELEVLLGKHCSETAFVTSQLTRAMDTFNIAMLPARLNCDFLYEISSNLQEFEHNRDCEARNSPGDQPTISGKQRDEYVADQMFQTFQYMEEKYSTSKTERFTRNLGAIERNRLTGTNKALHKDLIKSELDHMFRAGSESTKYVLWGGHSIWFRFAFRFFGDQQDPTCVQLGKVKIANVGAVSATLRKVQNSETPYAFVDCKWVHLGPSDEYTYEFDRDVESQVIPRPIDYQYGAKTIVGWRCCCPESATGRETDSAEGCLLAKSRSGKTKCGNFDQWGSVVGYNSIVPQSAQKVIKMHPWHDEFWYPGHDELWSARYGWRDDNSRPWCVIPAFDSRTADPAFALL